MSAYALRWMPWVSGYANPNHNPANTAQHTYKPKAIRIHSLLSLFFLFAICLIWLEIVLDKSIKPSEYYASRQTNISPEKRVLRRQNASPTCPSSEENARRLASFDEERSRLCVTYTTTYKPYTTDLSPALAASFDSWLAVYSSMEALSDAAEDCASQGQVASSLASLVNSVTPVSTSNTAVAGIISSSAQTSNSQSQPSNTQVANSLNTVVQQTSQSIASNTQQQPATSAPSTSAATSITTSSTVSSSSDSSTLRSSPATSASTTISAPSSSLSTGSADTASQSSPESETPDSTPTVSFGDTTTSVPASSSPVLSTTTPATTAPTPSTTMPTSSSSETASEQSSNVTTTPESSSSTTTLVEASSSTDPGSATTTSELVTTTPEFAATTTSESVTTTVLTTTTTTGSTIGTTPTCTAHGTPCYSCGADQCLCSSNNIFKRQNSDEDFSCIIDDCHCVQDIGGNGTWTCGDFNVCEDQCSSPFAEEGSSCLNCEYCTCQSGSCQPDPCHCSLDDSDEYTCGEENTCVLELPTDGDNTCLEASPGYPCYSCDASICACNMLPANLLLSRDEGGLSCLPDLCSCQWDSETAAYQCGDFNVCQDICSGPLTEEGTSCSNCESGDGTCQGGACHERPPQCSANGDACYTCEADLCLCRDNDGVGPFQCEIDTCHCRYDDTDGSYHCNEAVQRCIDTCNNDPESTPCGACDADVCTCQDGMCSPDACYCTPNPLTGLWTCGAENACELVNDEGCDSLILQCYGCDESQPSAACQCTPDGVCEAAPCPDCTFSEDGATMVCPESCTTSPPPGPTPAAQKIKRATAGAGKSIRRQLAQSLMQNSNDTSCRSGPRPWKRQTHARHAHARRDFWGVMDKREGIEVLPPGAQIPIRDAWNYLLWTEPLTMRRTSSSIVSTTVAATFTLDVFPGGSTSFPSLTSTPALTSLPTIPACVPATLIAPAPSLVKRDGQPANLETVKPYVTRESTTVVVRIRDNYMVMTSNVPTITKDLPATNTLDGALLALTTQTMQIQSVGADGSRKTQAVVVVGPDSSVTDDSAEKSNDDENDELLGKDAGGGGGGGASGSTTGEIAVLSGSQRVVNLKFTQGSYFAALYLPALMAVAIKILFETMVASIKMTEPFEQLHRTQGSSAEESLCSQYLSSSLSFDAFTAIWSGRMVPLWTLLIYVFISVGAPLASASMSVEPMEKCLIDGISRNCAPAWVVDLLFVRIMEALLALCLAMTVGLMWSSWRYHAGIPTNPTSIASMAILMNYEPLRQDMQAMEPDATNAQLSEALEQYHFWLLPHNPSRTQQRYGIVHSHNERPIDTSARMSWFGQAQNKFHTYEKVLSVPPKRLMQVTDAFHLFLTITLLALLTTYRANLSNDAFNQFFAGNTFAPKFILVCLASALDMLWKNLEREVRITEPYRRLNMGNAKPENTILISLNGTCWSNLPGCMRNLFRYSHMWFEAVVGITAVLSDINIIAVSGVLMTLSQTKAAYEFSSLTALITTSTMLVVLLITMIWWRRVPVVHDMPRRPETVAAVLSYLCSSRMAQDIANMGMENSNKEDRDAVIVGKGRRYRFGKMMGEDGRERWTVDYDDGDESDTESLRSSWLQEKSMAPAAVRLSR